MAKIHGPASIAAAAFLALASSSTVAVAADDASNDKLLRKVDALESEVQRLRSEVAAYRAASPATQPAVVPGEAEVNATKDAINKDVAARESLNLESFSTRYKDGQLQLETSDGAMLLHPFAHFQFRYIANQRDNALPGEDTTTESGFDLRRMEFGADGHLFGPDMTYLFLFEADRHNGGLVMEEAWVRYQLAGTPFAIRGGYFKDPFDHEQLTSGALSMAVERTLVNDLLAAGDAFSKGVTLAYDAGGPIRAEFAFTDGIGSYNTNFEDPPTNPTNWGTAGRVEYKMFGDWDQYRDVSAVDNKHDLLVFGGGYDYTEAGGSAAFRHVADIQYELGRLGLYGAYLGRYTKNNPVSGEDTYDWSLRAQAGFLISPKFEPFLRYDFLRFDRGSVPAGADPNVHEFALGFNYYVHGEQARFTADILYLPNGSTFDDDGTGVLANDGSAQFLLRGQFQFSL